MNGVPLLRFITPGIEATGVGATCLQPRVSKYLGGLEHLGAILRALARPRGYEFAGLGDFVLQRDLVART